MNSRELWQAVLGEVEVTSSPAVFKTWFKPTSVLSQEDGRIVIAVPSTFIRDGLKKRYHDNIKEIISRISPNIKEIEYKISTDTRFSNVPTQETLVSLGAPTIQSTKQSTGYANNQINTPKTTLNTKYTLDSFVVGPSNDLAFAACQAVATAPGVKYNPLFIYGGVGLGKTHLMQAVGNAIQAKDPSKQVAYITSEQFTREFLDSIQAGKKGKQFAEKYRNLDVLIVDDIQFLGNKERTQEEFFHTFNALHQANKQVIMSSDKPPKAIPNLEDRLRSRFEWGMVADIQKPDLETRAAIIQQKANSRGVNLSMEVVEYLARQYQNNIRELEGALTSILGQSELKAKEPSLAFITSLLGASAPSNRRKLPTPKLIIDKTSAYFDLQPSDICGQRRDKDIVVPRQIVMYLMRHELNLSYPKIAQHIGGRDHTTAMHSVQKIEKLIEVDEEIRYEVNQVKERISV